VLGFRHGKQELQLSLFSTVHHTRPRPSVWHEFLRREARQFAEPPKTDCRCLCQSADCAANYSACGGVATGDDVAERLRVTVRQPLSVLGRWIVDRHVITLSCGARLMLPLFQFDFDRGCVNSGAVAALSELTGVMTDNEVACWFAQPNAELNGAVPAQTLLNDFPAVLAAARADRCLALG